MRIAYFDCFSGVSGDMCLGALLDAGVSLSDLQSVLRALPIPDCELEVRKVNRCGLIASDVLVRVDTAEPARYPWEIYEILSSSTLESNLKATALRVFHRLVEAEARVHGQDPADIHLHEIGATDALVDVVGTIAGLGLLDVEEVYCSPLPLAGGWAEGRHGPIPLPGPAVTELLIGVPCYGSDLRAELVTPTGAALVSTLARSFCPLPSLRLETTGYGAGKTSLPHPNVLRLIIGEKINHLGLGNKDHNPVPDGWEEDEVTVLETALDDLPGESFGYLLDRLLAAGAMDVFYTPIQMKKNRPGVLVTVLSPLELSVQLGSIIFSEAATLGIRHRRESRWKLSRAFIQVTLPEGEVKVKLSGTGFASGPLATLTPSIVAPEYEDCRRLALATGRPLREVYSKAQLAACKALAAGAKPCCPDPPPEPTGLRG